MSEDTHEHNHSHKQGVTSYLWVVLLVIAVAACAGGGYYYTQYHKTQELLKNPTLAAQAQTQDLLTKVGLLIELPKDEQPTIATVADVTKLKDQPFFVNAQNGFKVLIYTNAKKAILYDPVANKIVEVAPVNIGASINPTPVVATPTPTKKPAK